MLGRWMKKFQIEFPSPEKRRQTNVLKKRRICKRKTKLSPKNLKDLATNPVEFLRSAAAVANQLENSLKNCPKEF